MLKAYSKGLLFISFMKVQIECMTTVNTHDSKLTFQGYLH